MLRNMLIATVIAFFFQTRIPVTYKFSQSEDISRVTKFSSRASRQLLVDIFNGSITVTGYDSDEVRIIVHKILHAKTEQALVDAEKYATLEMGEQDTGKIVVYLHVPWRTKDGGMEDQNLLRYDYDVTCNVEVKIPRRTNLTLSTVYNGDITVRGVDGTFSLRHGVGSIAMEDVSGSGMVK